MSETGEEVIEVDEQVVPCAEFVPERVYRRYGSQIACLNITDSKSDAFGYKIEVDEEAPIFSVDMPSEDAAKMLMADLYYGEYTGA